MLSDFRNATISCLIEIAGFFLFSILLLFMGKIQLLLSSLLCYLGLKLEKESITKYSGFLTKMFSGVVIAIGTFIPHDMGFFFYLFIHLTVFDK
jgi:hypothetical protein